MFLFGIVSAPPKRASTETWRKSVHPAFPWPSELAHRLATLPDLLDAARIDGSGVLGRYWHVVVPNIKPAIGTITIFAFLGAWNNFLWPLIILNSRRKMLIEQVLSVLTAEFAQEPAARMAAATMAVVPILLVFFFSQRYFVRGIALTGLK